MVIEIYYMNSKYVEFLYFIPLNVENNNLRRNYIMALENVENHLCGLERESNSKNLRNRQSQLWKRL